MSRPDWWCETLCPKRKWSKNLQPQVTAFLLGGLLNSSYQYKNQHERSTQHKFPFSECAAVGTERGKPRWNLIYFRTEWILMAQQAHQQNETKRRRKEISIHRQAKAQPKRLIWLNSDRSKTWTDSMSHDTTKSHQSRVTCSTYSFWNFKTKLSFAAEQQIRKNEKRKCILYMQPVRPKHWKAD